MGAIEAIGNIAKKTGDYVAGIATGDNDIKKIKFPIQLTGHGSDVSAPAAHTSGSLFGYGYGSQTLGGTNF